LLGLSEFAHHYYPRLSWFFLYKVSEMFQFTLLV